MIGRGFVAVSVLVSLLGAGASPHASASATTVPGEVGTRRPGTTLAGVACPPLDVRDKAALVVWPAVYADDWASAVSVVGELGVGGVLLMRPRLGAEELRARLDQLDAASELGVLIATDEEGGAVQRLVDIQPLASQARISTTMTPADAHAVIAAHAQLIADLGVDVVLGPVVDVLPVEGEPPLQRSRFFRGDPSTVAAYARAYVDGWESAGLLPVLKHFPGHGSASGDSHDVDAVTPPLDVLRGWGLLPYQQLVETGAGVMVGHLTVPGLTDGVPASASPAAVAYLRNDLGFRDALVLTDALDMAAAAADGSVPDAAVAALAAGVDVVLFTSTDQTGAVIEAIVTAVSDGRLPAERLDDAAGRVLAQLTLRRQRCAM